jgi:exopolysaccharide biosynthesis polyprenyl glycosylphosphotransferase
VSTNQFWFVKKGMFKMGKNYKRRFSNIIIAFIDILLINLGIAIAFWLRFGFQLPNFNLDPYLRLIPWISLSALIILYMFDLYTDWRRKSIHDLIYSLFLSVATLTIFTMVFTFWDRGFAFPRSVIFIAFFVQVILLVTSRSFMWLVSKKLFGSKKVLIIGNDYLNGLALAKKFLQHSKGWFLVEDFLLLDNRKKLKSKISNVDVILLSPDITREHKAEIISFCSKYGKEVLVVPELFELFLLDSEPQQIDDMLVLSILPPTLGSSQRLVKRTFDIMVSSILLILFSPIIFFLIVLIPLTSSGPAFFKQERLGRDSRPYYIYKFRSMVVNAEESTGPVLATEKDERITKLGKYIRSLRLDEMPQLINVIKGEMSLVGPRPEREFFIEQFKDSIPDYAYRMSVKPGITGLAQVMAKYSTTVEDKLRFDLMYVRNYSFALDIRILLQTIRVVLQREKANGVKIADEEDFEKTFMNLTGYSQVASTKD